MKNKKIVLNKSNRVSSPEELDAYIRIARPGVWIGLAAIVALLVGLFVWSFVGRIETQINGVSYVAHESTNTLTTYINSKNFVGVEEGKNQIIRLDNGKEIALKTIEKTPVEIEKTPVEVRAKGKWNTGDIVYVVTSDNSTLRIESGCYSSVVVTGSVTPMHYIFNF